MSTEFILPIRVYIEDTDAGGIVFYGNYLKFMERARTELLRELGLPKPAVLDEGMLLVVASVKIDYKKPAHLDEELLVSAVIVKVARSFVVFRQSVNRGKDCLSESEIKVACVNRDTMRPCAFPARLVKIFNK